MYSSIVVGTDGSETAGRAVQQAVALASSVGATLHVVTAYAPVGRGRLKAEAEAAPEDMQWGIGPAEDAEVTLQAAAAAAGSAGVDVQGHAVEGDPADAVLRVAEDMAADVIVVGNKGMTGTKRFLLGSVPNKISHHASCSVMIVRTS
jgi:nucleotide-binding universal stress UspA family protein